MRKKCYFIISFIFILLFINTNLVLANYSPRYEFIWYNTIVPIPVGEEIQEYERKPYALLMVDNEIKNDAIVRISSIGDWMYYLKDVDTTKVGTYKVWYKAYEDTNYKVGTCNNYKMLVTFEVFDNVKPTIKPITDKIIIPYGANDFDFRSQFILSDNITSKEALDFMYEGNIDFSTVDSKMMKFYVVDESGNKGECEVLVSICESSNVRIENLLQKSVIECSYNDTLDLSLYFKAYDNDKDISSYLILPTVDTKIIGSSKYEIKVMGYDGGSSRYEIEVVVADTRIPTINLTNTHIKLDYLTDISTIDFTKYIKSIDDDQEIDYNNLNITHNIENTVGSYYVNYTYTDNTHTVEEVLNVSMLSYSKPIIETLPITITVGNDYNLYDYITVIDESDPLILEMLEINDELVDYTKAGTYFATATVTNSSGLTTKKIFTIEIKDKFSKELIIVISISLVVFIIILVTSIYCIRLVKRKNK